MRIVLCGVEMIVLNALAARDMYPSLTTMVIQLVTTKTAQLEKS